MVDIVLVGDKVRNCITSCGTVSWNVNTQSKNVFFSEFLLSISNANRKHFFLFFSSMRKLIACFAHYNPYFFFLVILTLRSNCAFNVLVIALDIGFPVLAILAPSIELVHSRIFFQQNLTSLHLLFGILLGSRYFFCGLLICSLLLILALSYRLCVPSFWVQPCQNGSLQNMS